MENSNRVYFIDNLRAFTVFLVVVLHISLAYIVPQFPGWVHDPARPTPDFLWIIIGIADGPKLMATMFFLAGYFALSSYARKGAKQFIIDKLLRVGIPFAVGGTLIAYLLANIAYYSDGGKGIPVVSVPSFFKWIGSSLAFFSPENYQQYHFWFVGLLLWFFLITALVLIIFKQGISPTATTTGKPSLLFFIWFTVLTAGIVFIGSLLDSFGAWTVRYFIEFQNIFLPVYIAYFILGIYAYRRNWFKESGYRPRVLPWLIIYLIASTVHGYVYGTMYQLNPSTIDAKLLVSVTYSITIISWQFMLLAIFQRYLNKGGAFQRMISESAYSVYLIHLLLVFGMIIITRMMPIPLVTKLIINIVVVTLLAWSIGYALKKAPGFRKML